MGDLKDWAKSQSKFIKLENGEEIVLKYVGWKSIPSKFDPEKESVRYELEDIGGNRKYWENGTGAVANQFDAIPAGSDVKIKRVGEDKATKYIITKA